MVEDVNNLYEDIIYAAKDIDEVIKCLGCIKGPTICVGSGGSKVVAKYAEKVLIKKNKLIALTMNPYSFVHYDKELYDNVFIASHSGKNFGVKVALDSNLNKYLLSTRKVMIDSEILLSYEMKERKSFISISDTLIPMAILLKYYLGKKFLKTLDKIFRCANKVMDKVDIDKLSEVSNYNIFTGIDTEASSYFLESTFIEAGINVPIINYKYDYCHGRSTINKAHDNGAIYLGYDKRDLDKTLKGVLNRTMKDVIIINKISKDDIINDFYLTLVSIYLMVEIAKIKNINLKDIKYDCDAVHELYYFKGSM